MRRTRSVPAALLLALVALGGPAVSSAPAHTRLLASDPGSGSVLTRPPAQVRLRFTQPLSARLSEARILAPDGRDVAGVRAHVDRADRRVLVVELPRLGRGAYSTLWTAVGTTDPHRARGLTVFRVGPGALRARTTPRESPPMLTVLVRWLDFALVGALIGALAVIGLVLRPARRGAGPAAAAVSRRAEARLLRLAGASAAGALVFGVFTLPLAALVLTAWEPASVIELVRATRWGRLWAAREVVLAALVAVILFMPRRSAAPWLPLAATLAAALPVLRALHGHAADVAPQATLSVLVLSLHLLAAAVWVGGVLALAIGFWPFLRRGERAGALALLRPVWAPFGRLAALSVGVLAVTGLYTAGRQVASIDALITTLYGQVLGAKSGLLAVTATLGLLAAAVVHPTVGHRIGLRHPPRLRTLVLAEATAGLSVILAAAVMSSGSPARGPDLDPATPAPASLTAGGDGLIVTLSATPNRPGQNVLTAVVAATRRPDPPPPTGIDLHLPERGVTVPMRELDPGRFHIVGDLLGASGRMPIRLVVHRRGEPDNTVDFGWTTGSAPRRILISDRPLEPILTLAAALLALVFALFVARPPRRARAVPGRALVPQVQVRKGPS